MKPIAEFHTDVCNLKNESDSFIGETRLWWILLFCGSCKNRVFLNSDVLHVTVHYFAKYQAYTFNLSTLDNHGGNVFPQLDRCVSWQIPKFNGMCSIGRVWQFRIPMWFMTLCMLTAKQIRRRELRDVIIPTLPSLMVPEAVITTSSSWLLVVSVGR